MINNLMSVRCSKCNRLYYPKYINWIGKTNTCKECRKTQKKRHRKKPELWRKCSLPSNRKILRKEIFRLLGDKCIKCEFNDFRALEIDHINNNGAEERKKFKGCIYYKNIIMKIKTGSKDYQILCSNCNKIKEYNFRLKIKLNKSPPRD